VTSEKALKGKRGEEEAARYLESRGFKIIARNFRTRWGEIDIVARDRSVVVFVEVKTRSDSRFAAPEESVTFTKQERMRRAASIWLAEQYPNDAPQCRFDVVAVTLPQTPLPRTSASSRSRTSGDPEPIPQTPALHAPGDPESMPQKNTSSSSRNLESKDLHIEHFEGAFE
jgi:putative endonuclease